MSTWRVEPGVTMWGEWGTRSSEGTAALNTWQHVEFRRSEGVNSLWVNGSQVGDAGTTLFPAPVPELSIGAARNGGRQSGRPFRRVDR